MSPFSAGKVPPQNGGKIRKTTGKSMRFGMLNDPERITNKILLTSRNGNPMRPMENTPLIVTFP
jgi:hypothetical protein